MAPIYTKEQIKTELQKRIWAELRRRDPNAANQLVKQLVLDSLHTKQQLILSDIASGIRFLSLCTSRRAGKTYSIACMILLKLLEAGHNQTIVFISPTLPIGKRIIWDELYRLIQKYHLDWDCREHQGTIKTSMGGKFAILGLSTQGKAESPRGADIVAAFVDEVQDSEHLLIPLLTALEPALAGSGGILVLSGTPGFQPVGVWHDIACLGIGGFKNHHFTMLDNPHLEKPASEILIEVLERKGWTEQTPEFQREYKGLWAADDSQMVFSFHPNTNSILELPEDYGLHWQHCIGIDLGYNDLSAWSVLALDRATGRKVVVHSEAHPKLYSDQAATITKAIIEKFSCTRVVCDPAAGGLGFYEQFNTQHASKLGVTIKGANKINKEGRVALLNSELRSGKLTLLRPNTDALAKELQTLRYRNRDSCEFLTSTTIRDDLTDTLMYALVELIPIQPVRAPAPIPTTNALEKLFDRANRQQSVRDQLVG